MLNDHLSMEKRLENAGIETIYPIDFISPTGRKLFNKVKLTYGGKEIFRPKASYCVSVVKREFNIDM